MAILRGLGDEGILPQLSLRANGSSTDRLKRLLRCRGPAPAPLTLEQGRGKWDETVKMVVSVPIKWAATVNDVQKDLRKLNEVGRDEVNVLEYVGAIRCCVAPGGGL